MGAQGRTASSTVWAAKVDSSSLHSLKGVPASWAAGSRLPCPQTPRCPLGVTIKGLHQAASLEELTGSAFSSSFPAGHLECCLRGCNAGPAAAPLQAQGGATQDSQGVSADPPFPSIWVPKAPTWCLCVYQLFQSQSLNLQTPCSPPLCLAVLRGFLGVWDSEQFAFMWAHAQV